ncbi:unnamed protein product [Urochloa humidicola]
MDSVENMWVSSLPADLLVAIFRRLDASDIVRSAGVCKPWRRAIIDNASSLRPHPDRFNPSLLICCWHVGHSTRLQRLPTVHTATTTLPSFIPTGAARGIDLALEDDEPPPSRGGLLVLLDGSCRLVLPTSGSSDDSIAIYDKPLSSRDGFMLLAGSPTGDLCLRNPLTGSHKILPASSFKECVYALVTKHDLMITPSGGNDNSAIWMVLAVKLGDNIGGGMTYQIFSSESGKWGPIKRSGKLEEGLDHARIYETPKDVVVCDGAICLLGVACIGDVLCRRTFAIDVCTERTWTIELPEKYGDLETCTSYFPASRLALATSEDGRRLSLIVSVQGYQMEVWDHIAESRHWVLRRTVDVCNLLPRNTVTGYSSSLGLSLFCPRSGCMFVHLDGQDLLIGVYGGSARPIKRVAGGSVKWYPYEMDWSTYISRMKYY